MAAKKTPIPTSIGTTEAATPQPSPYPFKVEVGAAGAPPIKGWVLKLTDVGFLMRLQAEHHFKVGEVHEVRFELPGGLYPFREAVTVVKTYDMLGSGGTKGLAKHYTVEMHFRVLRDDKRQQILNFIKSIGQK